MLDAITPTPQDAGFPALRTGALHTLVQRFIAAGRSGVAPSGQGDNTIVVFDRSGTLRTPRLVTDPELSPLDLKLAPNGNIVVASE